jgi:hypothetical protein
MNNLVGLCALAAATTANRRRLAVNSTCGESSSADPFDDPREGPLLVKTLLAH